MYKRFVVLFSILMSCFCFLFFVLDSISCKKNLRQAAMNQQSYKLKICDIRGTIYDCRNIPMVNTKKKIVAAAIPCLESLNILDSIINDSQREELYKKCSEKTPFIIQVNKNNNLDSKYVKFFEVPVRYSGVILAPHIIGYLSENKTGVYGIEKAYDNYLSDVNSNSEICVKYDIDASGKIIMGRENIIQDKLYCASQGVVLNLDSRIQAIAEEVANKYISRGAVIITEVPNCEIRASVSLPSFFPGDISSYLNNPNSPLLNRALCSFNLGSIFKLITSAVSLEKNINNINFYYDCNGENKVQDAKFRCFNSKKHEKINLEEALAYSCNGYFVELIKNIVTRDKLLDMCQKLGLGKEIKLADHIFSHAGLLPSYESLENLKTLANFSFGQGKLLVTPMQISAIINTIASDGVYTQPKLVKNLVNKNMEIIQDKNLENLNTKTQVLSKKITDILKSCMKASVDYGTSSRGKPENNITCGAKTSTAQTGIIENNKKIEQSWYAGFFPYENPKYSIVILSEAGRGGGESAGPVFKEIIERIYNEIPEIFV